MSKENIYTYWIPYQRIKNWFDASSCGFQESSEAQSGKAEIVVYESKALRILELIVNPLNLCRWLWRLVAKICELFRFGSKSSGNTDFGAWFATLVGFVIGICIIFSTINVILPVYGFLVVAWYLVKIRSQKTAVLHVHGDQTGNPFVDNYSFGEPGAGLSYNRFGNNGLIGIEGERRTASIIDSRLRREFPSLRVVHSVGVPGKDHADVDHVLILGSRVLIVDTKNWSPGHYCWNGKKLYDAGWECNRYPYMNHALSQFEEVLKMPVHGVFIVHSNKGAGVQPDIVNERPRVSRKRFTPMLNEEQFVKYVIGYFSSVKSSNVVMPDLIAKIEAFR